MAHTKTFDDLISYFKSNITTGVWQSGSRLPSERDLSETLGVSRPAIREALRALEIIGMVKSVHGGGNYVADDLSRCLIEPMSIMFAAGNSNVCQVQSLRRALEGETAKLAAQNCTERETNDLLYICRTMLETGSERIRADLDRRLHYSIAEYAKNPLILSTLNAASSLIEELICDIRVMIIHDYSSDIIDGQHLAIVSAIAKGDQYLATKCMNEHMELIEQYIMRMQGR